MPVYLARFGALGPVKIGHSLNVSQRIAQISVRLWDDMVLIRCLDGGMADERALHKRFAHLRIRNEWFHYGPEMMGDLGLPDLRLLAPAVITELEPRFRTDPIRCARTDSLRAWMLREGLTERMLAEALGSKPQTIAEWLQYGSRPTPKVATRLIELSDGDLADAFGTRDTPYSFSRAKAA